MAPGNPVPPHIGNIDPLGLALENSTHPRDGVPARGTDDASGSLPEA
jgi:hypothetical protein